MVCPWSEVNTNITILTNSGGPHPDLWAERQGSLDVVYKVPGRWSSRMSPRCPHTAMVVKFATSNFLLRPTPLFWSLFSNNYVIAWIYIFKSIFYDKWYSLTGLVLFFYNYCPLSSIFFKFFSINLTSSSRLDMVTLLTTNSSLLSVITMDDGSNLSRVQLFALPLLSLGCPAIPCQLLFQHLSVLHGQFNAEIFQYRVCC